MQIWLALIMRIMGSSDTKCDSKVEGNDTVCSRSLIQDNLKKNKNPIYPKKLIKGHHRLISSKMALAEPCAAL